VIGLAVIGLAVIGLAVIGLAVIGQPPVRPGGHNASCHFG
jgi:hypothetical protein